MKKTKVYVDVTDAEIDAAIARGKVYDETAQHATAVAYRDHAIEITFATGVKLTVPARLLQGLKKADEREIARVELLGDDMLHWESLDVDHYIPGVLKGVFGNRAWMRAIGKRGGSTRTPAKRAAARANGRKGGRPRKRAAA